MIRPLTKAERLRAAEMIEDAMAGRGFGFEREDGLALVEKLKAKEPLKKSTRKGPWVTRKIRRAVYARSGTRCENPACTWTSPPTVDHFYGKANAPETVETCWVLCARCHREKTDSKPNRKTWLLRFRGHCVRYGYVEQVAECDKKLAELDDEEKQRAQAEVIRDAYNRGDSPT